MKKILIQILTYGSVIIAAGTIVWRNGLNTGVDDKQDEVVLHEIQSLRVYTEENISYLQAISNQTSCKMDSVIKIVEQGNKTDVVRYKEIQREILILTKQDKSGEALKAINEWREWYKSMYEVQQVGKKNSIPYGLEYVNYTNN